MRIRDVITGLAILACFQSACSPLFGQQPEDYRFLSPQLSAADDEAKDEIETDRDSFTPATTIAGTGRIIFESSYSYLDNRQTVDSHSYPEILTRVGICDGLEFRLGWNYEVGGGGSVSGGGAEGEVEEPGTTRDARLLYGLKGALTEQDAWMPESAYIVQARTPTYGPESATDFQLGYVFGWKLINDWKLDASMRYIASDEEHDRFNQWAPSVVLKVPFADRWNVHAEYFGIMTDGKADENNAQYFSPGIHYLLTPDCEIGVRVGWGLNEDAANFFSNVGIGLRI